jgi:hypothetical protein
MKKMFTILGTLIVCNANLWAMLDCVMSGQTNFNNGNLIGSVEYMVFGPDQYPGTTAFPSTDYVYVYRVFNDVESSVSIDFFSVDINTNTIVGNLTYETEPGDVIPGSQSILSETVLNLFYSMSAPIPQGGQSAILLFSSPFEPTQGFGTVSGGLADSEIVSLATPVPEPATLSLLILGGIFTIRSRRS